MAMSVARRWPIGKLGSGVRASVQSSATMTDGVLRSNCGSASSIA